MIERFRLPDSAFAMQGLMDSVSCGSLDAVSDFGEGADGHFLNKGYKDQMDMGA
jgi:hypothetical protein